MKKLGLVIALVFTGFILPVVFMAFLLVLSGRQVVEAAPRIDKGATRQLLTSGHVGLLPAARRDLENGLIDPRVVSLLAWISERHSLGIGVLKTGHSKFVRGTNRVSNHWFGRAADIFSVDGERVTSVSPAARELVRELGSLSGPLRPDEIGNPFGSLGIEGAFTDADHTDHIHIGFD